MRLIGLIFTFFLWSTCVWGQFQSLRSVKIKPTSTRFTLDSLTIVPGSVQCIGCGSTHFVFDEQQQTVNLSNLPQDSITVFYRVFPWRFTRKYAIRHLKQTDSTLLYTDFYSPPIKERHEEFLATPGIEKTGSLTRGISFGNSQNVFVNSGLNLQLEGMLNNDIRVSALISDQRVPFQPQGNTQQIREFDRVLIQLDHKHASLMAGDIVLKNRDTEFLRYYKNVQGGQATINWRKGQKSSTTTMSAAIAKGKFASIGVEVREGVQGPYRLRPPGISDVLVIILANSEKVFFDGKLMKRGFNYDYIIDYNTGELTFTNTVMITRFTRVRVDFEYAERNYNRSILQAGHHEQRGRFFYGADLYRESDNPNRPLSFELNPENELILRMAGDSAQKAVISTAARVENFSAEGIYYQKVDTLINGVLDSIFVYAPKGEGVLYQVAFTNVGLGNGDYVILSNLSNGRTFRFVGKNQGDFAPIRQLVTPNSRSMLNVYAGYELAAGQRIITEWAYSGYDRNRYSRLDAADNNGQAWKAAYQLKPFTLSKLLRLQIDATYLYLGKYFNPIDRFRPIEFDRDWGANAGDTLRADEHFGETMVQLTKDNDFVFHNRLALRAKGDNANGHQHESSLKKKLGFIDLNARLYGMQNRRSTIWSQWNRWSIAFVRNSGVLRPGYEYSQDDNRFQAAGTDSIVRTQMNYTAHRFFVQNADTLNRPLMLEYIYREDFTPLEGRLQQQFQTRQINAKVGWQSANRNSVFFTLGYREMTPNAIFSRQLQKDRNLLGRFDWNGRYFNNLIITEMNYFTGTSQELRREYQFVRITAVGEGTHQWIDLNNDGIQQLDEFIEATRPEDRQYIKIFTPTNDFITAYLNQLNFRLNLNAPRDWQQASGVKKIAGRFSNIAGVNAVQRNTADGFFQRYLPVGQSPGNELLSRNLSVRNSLFYNRANAASGGEYAIIQGWQTILLTNGFQTRRNLEHRLTIRKNLSQSINCQLLATHSNRTLESDFLSNQNYQVQGYEVGPELSYQPGITYRFTLSPVVGRRQNLSATESASLFRLSGDARINQANERNINLGLRYINFGYNSDNTNTLVAYEILDGLQPGSNFTWSVYATQRMAQGLQLSVQYDGRKSALTRIIHIGRMQATVLF